MPLAIRLFQMIDRLTPGDEMVILRYIYNPKFMIMLQLFEL
jgi:hypothetical protein